MSDELKDDEEIQVKRGFLRELMEDLNEWTEKVPAPYRFAEWAALIEHRLGLTLPMDFDDDGQPQEPADND